MLHAGSALLAFPWCSWVQSEQVAAVVMWPFSFRTRYKTSSWAHRLAMASGRQGAAERPEGQREAVPALYTMLPGTGAGAHLAVVLRGSFGLYFIVFPPNIMTRRKGRISLFTA